MMEEPTIPLAVLSNKELAEDYAVSQYVAMLTTSGELNQFVKLAIRAAKRMRWELPVHFDKPFGGVHRDLHAFLVYLALRHDYPEVPQDGWGNKL